MLTHFSVLLVSTRTLKSRELCIYMNLTRRLKCTLVSSLFHTCSLLSNVDTWEFTNNFVSKCAVVRFSCFLVILCSFLNSRFLGKMNTLWNLTFSASMLMSAPVTVVDLSEFLSNGMQLYHDWILELWPFKESLAWFFPLHRMTQVAKEIPTVPLTRMLRERAQNPDKGSSSVQNIY